MLVMSNLQLYEFYKLSKENVELSFTHAGQPHQIAAAITLQVIKAKHVTTSFPTP